MLLIGDPNDSSGNGMFSKNGRKLNQFFINLSKRDIKTTAAFLSQFSKPKSDQMTSEHIPSSNPSSSLTKKSKHAQQPFTKIQGRAYYKNLDLKKIQGPSFANYRIAETENQAKVLRNYNFEKPTRKFSEGILQSNTNSNVNVPVCKRMKVSFLTEKAPRPLKLLGFNDLNKQLPRPDFIPFKKDFEVELNSQSSFNHCKVTSSQTFIDFSKSIGRFQRFRKNSLQRNNYALNVKRDLIEPNTKIIIPSFSKTLDRKTINPKSSCFNREFYDYQLLSKHVSTPNFKIFLPEKKRVILQESNMNKMQK